VWTVRSVLPWSIAIAPPGRRTASSRTTGTSERNPLVPGHLIRLDEPVSSEFRPTESSSPDLGSQRVGRDSKLCGGFPESQEGHIDNLVRSCLLRCYSYASRYISQMLDRESNGRTRREGTTRGDRMFGLAGGVRGDCGVLAPDSGR